MNEFDHSKAGYVLEGGHRSLECRKCHAPKNITPAERRKIVVKNLARTYLGLSRECLNCHMDEHRGQLSSDCLQCHTFSKWKPASQFDHDNAQFQIGGAHRKVSCVKCHATVENAKPYAKFKGLAYATCDACHTDPHRDAFSASCESCHSVEGWKPARLSSQFDHAGTTYPLLGRHSSVACGKCHPTSNFKEPVAHAQCLDCHKTDVHDGQFASREDRGECSACHLPEGWKPSTFKIVEHRATRYPLEGRHATVPCAKCHLPAGKATVYRIKFGLCGDCHTDPHKNQFAGPPHLNRCEGCHTVKGFRPSTFSVARHAETRFRLTEAHRAVVCADCHDKPQSGLFRFIDSSCTRCHEDPHLGQFKNRMLTVRADGGVAGCEACHTLRTWRDVSRFDHSTTGFPLSGTHRAVACKQCHRPTDAAARTTAVVFLSASKQCIGCHEDIHAGQFASSSGSVDCARCHGQLQWKPASFDHDRATGFPLTGAHQQLKCALCHKAGRRINGRYVMLFKPAPRECDGCHGPDVTD